MKRFAISFPCAAILLIVLSYLQIDLSRHLINSIDESIQYDTDPSHIQICRSILKPPFKTISVKEKLSVCHDKESPYFSILQMFVSAFLADISHKNGLDISYGHNCDSRQSPAITVQELFPYPLILLPAEKDISFDAVKSVCRSCLEKYHQFGFSSPDCLFSGPTDTQFPVEALSRKMIEQSLGMETILPSIKANLQRVLFTWDQSNLRYPEPEEENAVIYLSCQKEGQCVKGDYLKDYKHIFAQEIPSYIKRIDIIATPFFVKKYAGAGKVLQEWLKTFFPRTYKVNYIIEESTAISFPTMMKAKYLVCPPGLSSLLPALSTSNYASIIQNLDLYPWVNHLSLESNVNLLDPNFQPSQCVHLRGQDGMWVQDHKLAPSLQYMTPHQSKWGSAERCFHSTPENPFRPSTTYKWVEKSFPQCSFNPLTPGGLCAVLKDLQISRLFFLGDSLSVQQAISLLKSIERLPKTTLVDEYLESQSHMIQCPENDFEFMLTFVKNVKISETSDPVWGGDYPWSNPWIELYSQYPGKTLLIANTGAHIPALAKRAQTEMMNVFKHFFNEFLDVIDKLGRRDDLIFFRSTLPGHHECNIANRPFLSYKEYEKQVKNAGEMSPYRKYGWYKFMDFNDYATKELNKRKRKKVMSHVRLLDVVPMSVLRQDGRDFYIKKCTETVNDCLHYSIPGPVDWWNHLLYNNLVSILNGEEVNK